MWIFVNLDARYNFFEFCHILAGSRMQPTNRQVTVELSYVSVTDVN
jgi:hypothetical protein